MRKIILNVAMITGLAIATFNSYGQVEDKKAAEAREDLKDAKQDVVGAKSDLQQAEQDSVADYQKFKKDADLKIKSNAKRIAELNTEILTMDAKDRDASQKRISELEQKNNSLKKKLADAKYEGPDNWSLFKIDFNKEMDKLAKSLKDFTTTDHK